MFDCKKRLLTIILSAVLLLTINVGAASDIGEHWASEKIARWADRGIINGYPDGTFMPDNKVTRAELCAVVCRLLSLSKTGEAHFSDVPFDMWYAPFIETMNKEGFISGYGDGTMNPEGNVTREEVAEILYKVFRLDRLTDNTETSFSDEESISDWAAAAVAKMSELGYIKGYGDGSYKPKNAMTRAEIVSVLDNIVKNIFGMQDETADLKIDGNVIVSATNKIFKACTVNGDLFVTEAVNGGELRFDNVTVTGRLIVSAADNTAIIFKDSNINAIEVQNSDSTSVIVASGTTSIKNTRIYSNAKLLGIDGITAFDKATIDDCADVTISGNVNELSVKAKSNITIEENSKIYYFEAEKAAVGTTVSCKGAVANTKINSTIEVNGVKTGYGGIITAKAPTETSTFPSKGFGGGGGGGGGSSSSSEIPIGNDAFLADLAIEQVMGVSKISPSFDSDVLQYNVKLKNIADSFSIMCNVNGKWTDCFINQNAVSSGDEYVYSNIPVGSSSVVIDLKIGLSKKKTYTINVIRLPAVDAAKLSDMNADFTAVTLDMLSDIMIDNLSASELSQYRIALQEAKTQKGSDLTDADIQEVIDDVNYSSATLLDLSVVNTTAYKNNLNLLRPKFDGERTDYDAYVDNYIDGIQLVATGINNNISIKINGTEAKQNIPFKVNNLQYGDNVIEVEVMSADGSKTAAYTVAVHRDADVSNLIKNSYFSDGADCYGLNNTVSTQTEDGWQQFSRENPAEDTEKLWDSQITQSVSIPTQTKCILEFEARTSNGIDKTVQVTQMDSAYKQRAIVSNGTGWNFIIKGETTVYSLPFTATTLDDNIMTIRFDIGVGTPAVEFKKMRLTEVSNDSTLKVLSLDNGNLSPSFSSDVINYTVFADSEIQEAVIDAIPNSSESVVTINSQPVTGAYTANLLYGNNVYLIAVTAPSGGVTNYTLTINRAIPQTAEHPSAQLQRYDVISNGSWANSWSYNNPKISTGTLVAVEADDPMYPALSVTKYDGNGYGQYPQNNSQIYAADFGANGSVVVDCYVPKGNTLALQLSFQYKDNNLQGKGWSYNAVTVKVPEYDTWCSVTIPIVNFLDSAKLTTWQNAMVYNVNPQVWNTGTKTAYVRNIAFVQGGSAKINSEIQENDTDITDGVDSLLASLSELQ